MSSCPKQSSPYQASPPGAPGRQSGKTDTKPPTTTRRRFMLLKAVKRALLLTTIGVVASGGILGWKLYQDASKLTGNKNPLALLSAFTPATLHETNGRVNILLAGNSADDSGHQGAELTDSIMIISINVANKSAVVISVPRDLYVNIPGYGYSKINAAYEYGESKNFNVNGYAKGGMGLLEQIISQDFGIQFGYQALINYAAFKDAVDAVGDVSVDIESSNPSGLYDPNTNLKLPNGITTLNGQQALNLARARGDGYGSYGFTSGDFDRTIHQQQILVALKDKANSSNVIANPLKIASLADVLGNNVKTDMSIGAMETLYRKTKGISDSSIKTITLNDYNGQNYLSSYTTASGQSALIPAAGIDDYNDIQTLLTTLLPASTAAQS